jgi:hypothetical protein
MHLHHIVARSRGGTDDYVEWKSEYDHAYDHALDAVLFPEIAPPFDFRHKAWPLLPEDLKQLVREANGVIHSRMQKGKPGKPHTAKARKKISLNKLGKKRGPLSQEWKDKIADTQRERGGKPHSEETKAKLRLNGGKHTKGTFWWVNTETKETKRTLSSPGDKWKKGRA